MTTADVVILSLWLAFYAYWAISAIGVKKNIRHTGASQRVGIRILILAALILLFRVPVVRQDARNLRLVSSSHVVQAVGIAVCLLGLGLAVWARLYLGRNWGQPMTLKEGHELVTTGPYRYVRHPIYAGILLAMLASAFVTSGFWLVAFVFIAAYFVYAAKTEERIMSQQFPNEYANYRSRTKAIVPFVW